MRQIQKLLFLCYDELVETINKFVKEKGYSSRLTTVLYTLFKVLQDAVEKYQPSTGDTDIDAIEEHSLHERNIVAQTMWRIESSVKSIYEASASEIREKGRNVANEISGSHGRLSKGIGFFRGTDRGAGER